MHRAIAVDQFERQMLVISWRLELDACPRMGGDFGMSRAIPRGGSAPKEREIASSIYVLTDP